MKGIRVDPSRGIARAEPGVLLGEFDRETQAFDMATTAGVVSTTGMAGLTLGGGIGFLGRRYGLACDNLLSIDLVTAAGRLITASADENSDLFWGIRGGGGNFGIATSFEYRLHRVGPMVLGGSVVYSFDKARNVLKFYARVLTRRARRAIGQHGARHIARRRRSLRQYRFATLALFKRGRRVLAPLRKFGDPQACTIGPGQLSRCPAGRRRSASPMGSSTTGNQVSSHRSMTRPSTPWSSVFQQFRRPCRSWGFNTTAVQLSG